MFADSLSNRISSFILTACANEQCNYAHTITGYSFLLDKLLLCIVLIVIIFWLFVLLSLVYPPLIFWNLVLSPAVSRFVPRFYATVSPSLHLCKQSCSGLSALFILLFLVCFWLLMILFITLIYIKFMINQHIVSLDNRSWILIVYQWFPRIQIMYNWSVIFMVRVL